MMEHGARDAERLIQTLMDDPNEEIERRINSSYSVFYYNKKRQAAHEKKLREAFSVDLNFNVTNTNVTDFNLNLTATRNLLQ